MVTLFATLFVVSPVSGSLSDRIGSRMLCTLGMFILMLSFFFMSGLPADATAISIGWRLALAGTGTAIFLSPNSAVIMNSVPGPYRGTAGSTVAVAPNFGMVFGIAMAGAIFNTTFYHQSGGQSLMVYHKGLESIFMAGFRNALYAGGCVAGIGMIVSFLRGADNRGGEKHQGNRM